ncbi:MAG: exosortase/archaeosortase family protein [Chthoniobacterales bacterium]
MTAAAQVDVVRSTTDRATLWLLALAGLFFVTLLAELVVQLGPEWSFNPQYSYAWSVPFLALYLLRQRWTQRPAPAPPPTRFLPIALVIFCAALLLPIRFVAQSNADWRLLDWALALSIVLISLGVCFVTGGLPWLRHFAFPICFLLVSVPWPVRFEQIVIQDLMRAVSAINVSLLNLAGVPALQHGNVIEIGNGFIGIEEACSGVRSFQATFMISLFLGEFYSFTAARRVLLIAAGALLAFLCNLVRTAILVWVGAKRGTSAIAGWHDPAGITILVICLFALWFLSLRMQRQSQSSRNLPQDGRKVGAGRFSAPLLLFVTIWVLLAESAVQVWARVHPAPIANSRWDVQWPTAENTYKPMTIPVETRNLLRYHQGAAGMWRGDDGHPWLMYFFRWLPGRTAGLSVKIHRPDICLPATGMVLTRDNGARRLSVNGVDLHVHAYRFEDRGVPLHVLYCYGDVRSDRENLSSAEQEDWTARGRLRAALKGRPEIGAVLELVVWGYHDDAEADAALERQLQRLVRGG